MKGDRVRAEMISGRRTTTSYYSYKFGGYSSQRLFGISNPFSSAEYLGISKVSTVKRFSPGFQTRMKSEDRAPQVTIQGRYSSRWMVAPAIMGANRICDPDRQMISGRWLWPRKSNPRGLSLKNRSASFLPMTPIMADNPN